ncbi:YcgL domain-containing protein [Luteimonas sp. 50]|uniref:YcgL domain-containing protein MQC88_10865 n=1 Tax=Cognatiluteimonas sedimenti TaxID=2927791 RepID=A0ABT0A679_9GAMM|nr:YcgL domain-containing protein [Lysobacter sedimenti]MCJ0826445.1 YcgL domain-containing protein [Lysobacter sedimenti]
MHAHVYKSLRKDDTYVYLAARDDFTRLPETLRTQLGGLQFVLEVALTPGRKLAREDVDVVRGNLALRGFHLQFPPASTLDPMSEDWGTDA